MKRKILYATMILMIALGGFALLQPSGALAIEPGVYLVEDNPSCATLNASTQSYFADITSDFGFKLDGAPLGTFPLDGSNGGTLEGGAPSDPSNSVTIENVYAVALGEVFDWAASLGIDAVIVKGGPNANAFVYVPESYGDDGLHAPVNPANNLYYGISHIEFCYDYELDVSKDANTSLTRTWTWTIEKGDDATYNLFTGDSQEHDYLVTVDATSADSDWAVDGTITIANNTPLVATITDVSDVISPDIGATVNCSVTFPYNLASGNSLDCSYTTPLPDGTFRTNTATVETSGPVGGGSAEADVDFSGATVNHVDEEISVGDNPNGSLGTVNALTDTLPMTFPYSDTFTCDVDAGEKLNTATFTANDTSTTGSASATVTIICHQLTVTKDANTSLTRRWTWTIDKEDDATYNLFTGDSQEHDYLVTVDATSTDDSWAVNGGIAVFNPAPMAATINSVTDIVSPNIAASVSCGVTFPYSLASLGTLNCTYSASLPNADARTNTAKATLQNYAYDSQGMGTPSGTTGFSSSAVSVDFNGATVNHVDEEISVSDNPNGSLGAANALTDTLPVIFPYSDTFACDADEGENLNTATFTTNDTSTTGSASATVTIICHELTVTKGADPALTRTWTWTIDKSADQTNLLLSDGQLFQVNYEVTVDASSTDSDWAVTGDIWIANPHPSRDATLTAVSDVVSPAIAATVNCLSLTVPSGGSLHCTYSVDLPDASTRTNTATATLQNYAYDSEGIGTPSGTTDFSGSTAVDFSSATISEIDECIDVSDTNVGFLGTVCAGDAPHMFSYSLWFGRHPDADVFLECGSNTHTNIADFVTNDTSATGQDDWTVTADAVCDVGCTLTPGYWKTHSEYGPAPYDDTWAMLSDEADTPFFLSGQSYFEVLWTSPQGNAYYILAHAYIAAELNQLNGASIPGDVLDAFNDATDLFNTYTPDQVADFKGKDGKETRQLFIDLAEILDDYNNGLLGPGHCSE